MRYCIPQRYVFALMAHLGVFISYAMVGSLSVAIVAMTNSTRADNKSSLECKNSTSTTTKTQKNGEFNWSEKEQGLVLASFFYGYLFTQLPGGYIANKFGGKLVFGFGVFSASVFTLLTQITAKMHLYVLIADGILMGVGMGVTFPALHTLIVQWSPPADISKFTSYTFSGMYSGTIFCLPISGLLADSNFLGGWPSVFYVFGTIGVVWFILWLLLVFNNPNEHPYISEAERNFLTQNQQQISLTHAKVPWFSILTSIHVWAILVAHFSNSWVWYMVLTGLPTYFEDVLDFNLKEVGFLSALPFAAAFFAFQFSAWFSDLIRRKSMNTKNARRLIAIIGSYPSAMFLILASYSGCANILWSVFCMVAATAFISIYASAFFVNHLDISPKFGDILMGLSNTLGTVAGCITPSVTGYFTNGNASSAQYRYVFFIAAAICAAGGTFFLIFLSGEVQSWNNSSDEISTSVLKKVSKTSKCSD